MVWYELFAVTLLPDGIHVPLVTVGFDDVQGVPESPELQLQTSDFPLIDEVPQLVQAGVGRQDDALWETRKVKNIGQSIATGLFL